MSEKVLAKLRLNPTSGFVDLTHGQGKIKLMLEARCLILDIIMI
jgi:hypothetical protein